MTTMILAAGNDDPGWWNLIALFAAFAVFTLFLVIKARIQRVRRGEEINPFSSERDDTPFGDDRQVDTSPDDPNDPTGKEHRKWL